MSSPASTGPAGAYFEAQVGAHYLLTMLIGAEPRGLPGTTIDRIEFQRGAEGYPLDDIIVHAHDRQGNNAVLEIQVKRSVTFAPSDREFKSIVGQISEASKGRQFRTSRHELAVAVARSSQRIEGPYQDVLTWARHMGSSETFFSRIERAGSANDNMRTFVLTFKENLRDAGIRVEAETVWRLLSRFQILPFDYTAQGSAFESWDKERAARVLHSDAAHHAGDLWKRLIELAIETASSGGESDQARLKAILKKDSFRLAGAHQFATARAALAEAARHALDDIHDQVADVSLLRAGWLNAVRSALTRGRYVEIRGDAGVGKSALLRHIAQRLANEAPIIVLSPKRTTGGGWTAMRAVLGFDGSARSLLVDLASSGGATLFLDGLDFFTDDERLTVRDLVTEASEVPGFNVIATSRRDFGLEEPNWLAEAALERLGRVDPVTVGELSTTEVSELQAIAPELGALLAESHPARAVTRNLFRLSRLAKLPGDAQVLRTEIDMAEQWWKSADGASDALLRERVRVLRDLSEQTLDRREPLETKSHPAPPVDALVRSQTLRDLGDDRMAFHHDVLRDWAVGNLLYTHPDTQDRLPLDQPAPASLVRGVEITARMALERHKDDSRWRELLNRLSHEDAHGSWRRAVLLAPVRSEIDNTPLETVSDVLLADQGRVLRELIGTVLAVDGRSATEFAAHETDVPEGLYIPAAPSWVRLIRWLLALGERVPRKAIHDVVRLYTGWCALGVGLPRKIRLLLWLFSGGGQISPSDVLKQYDGLFVPDGEEICKRVLEVFRRWLAEIEKSRYPDGPLQRRRPFNGELSNDQVSNLEESLRTAFLTLCHINPSLASEYVRSLLARGRQAHPVRLSVISSSGSLTHAAPNELALLAITALVPNEKEKTERRLSRPPFLAAIHLFSPPSPDHGPFIDLLTHAPKVGLSLVRQIVDYAISHYTEGKTSGASVVSLPFPDENRVFTSPQTYPWARASQSRDFCVTSALMALSKWGKQRIENGESLSTVLADVLGCPDSPAAYLLIAVDLLLDHWRAPREPAIPFLACPELLCLDRSLVWSEYMAERLPGRLVENPVPRPAAFPSLIDLLGHYALSGQPELRVRLVSLLRAASDRLGPCGEESSLNDPVFMALHALNRLDPSNWRQSTDNPAGATVSMEYVAPEAEDRHLARLESQSRSEIDNANLRAAIMLAVEDATKSSPDLAAAAVKWAQQAPDDSPDHRWITTASALLVVRDGDDDARTRHEEWARIAFADATRKDLNPLYEAAHTLSLNPPAIAFVGMSHLLKSRLSRADIRPVLDMATREDCAAAPGFSASIATLHKIDGRLPRAVLRTALASCIRLYDRGRWLSAEQRAALTDQHHRRIRTAVEAEQAWLDGRRCEPAWPPFTHQEPSIERGIPIFRDGSSNRDRHAARTPPPTEDVSHRSAALWLNIARGLFAHAARPWLRKMAGAYASWTAVANGLGRDQHENIDSTVLAEWNESYSALLAYCLTGMETSELDHFALTRITSLPDRSFIGFCEQFMLHIDKEYFTGHLGTQQAVHIRSVLIDRLITSDEWRRWRAEWMASERNLGRLVGRLFMHDGWSQLPRCWLHPDGGDLVDPLLPTLQGLVEGGPCIFFALRMLEVDPRPNHLEFIVAAADAWLRLYHDTSELWVDHAVGRRLCGLIDNILAQRPSVLSRKEELRKRVDDVVVSLTGLGVVEAAALEQTLANAEE